MAFEFKLPDIGEGVVEGEIVAWHREVGEYVREDDPLVEVMTDKATVTIPSPRAGVVKERRFNVGETAPVGDLLVIIDDAASPGAGAPLKAAPAQAAPVPAVPVPAAPVPAAKPVVAAPPAPAVVASVPAPAAAGPSERVQAAPATRKLARELGVDLRGLEGTGRSGRVTKDDVQALAQRSARQDEASAAPPAALDGATGGAETRIPIRGLRKRIYEKMAQSKRAAAHFTYVDEVDMQALVEVRTRVAAAAEKRGLKVTFMPFFMKAMALAIRDTPHVNAHVDDNAQDLIVHSSCNISVAVATDAGLTVPVVRAVQDKTIYELAAELADKAERARQGRLSREDFASGTITLTSLGSLGGMFATPIINYPEVAILGIHKIEERPVVVGGQVCVRQRMYLSSSFDHRVIDGHVGAAYVQRVKQLLEDPAVMLAELR
jgi:pyruvate dehydrogenase E2 component (dihydrolipoamide acetyltransferase)